ncbi:homoserine dehydrogenase [Clostridium acetobutylicum]|uniref:Homoserine dehydrogenase n=1 Tax=Clostridium acetobutylicum (strain ATCC 824 / DSM 792 / JCM 1419 / IAM 19013 / LMG 5710 / NBRC 13948 / NRRL B-527 / VKM B-1787 / 2291 / W) TaxID=272562 RepID=Q97KC1_CLOAB|nr:MULTISPECIES: homoserine dehydrogenase [Clostridium]AAK78974.1 Homoserine dehydrogenase [Clostridium acetobutylicum ATCC 824]ADZ20048.1 Homoserine dehydrogenase [Clostridium acetobutylicum EA 2018]AEI34099.1 homoserine dehydrogenase [Clostridium acetobutylicum DSM 1731]AWV81770.1 homoserine dehydrogenase [Clostridium acetobutylicum]KHD35610.1 homoserine dehydrogenase [Clostridium acetobutylicum]
MDKIKIGILGLGNVGRGVLKILNTNKEEIQKRSGYDIEIGKILVRNIDKNRGIDVPRELLTVDPDDILEDESIKIVIEVIGGINPAKDYILRAMKNKKHVVTANKMLLATEGDELFDTAEEEGVMFYYEASVAGGIPIIHAINESLTANKIEQLIGIINGTTNYILTKMTLEKMNFHDALREAQEKGFAEADPTSDIEAYDAMYKLAILSSLSFGTKINVDDVYREGITKIEPIDIEFAREFGYVIKLVAIVKETETGLEMRVHPTMIPERHPLANVNDSFNAIFIKGNAVGDIMLYGRGAGDLPTGSAVVADVISILRGNVDLSAISTVKKNYWNREINPMDKTRSEYYVRITVKDLPGVLGEISMIFGEEGVSLLSVMQKGKREECVTVVYFTHSANEGMIKSAIDRIKSSKYTKSVDNIIRIENIQ